MRSMKLEAGGETIYQSTFDERTGTLARVVEVEGERWDRPWSNDTEFKARYPERHYSSIPFSPVPELLDISITDKCNFGCKYCYQDSRPKSPHGPKDLVETILKGFNQPPYQIAIGGGEPTLHPDFDYILRTARELGTVPNFTTAGDAVSDDIIKTANDVCGGVAMTFHAFKGIEWFVEHYKRLRDKLKIQLNIHIIADKDIAKNLDLLVDRYEELGNLRLVLLAYYPDVGRATMDSLITKRVYQKDLPQAVKNAQGAAFDIAFSEGLLPYFNSRPELGVNTKLAMPSEGFFSCYFDPRGRMSKSSFDPPREDAKTAFDVPSQKLWDGLHVWSHVNGDACYQCEFNNRCSTPHNFHYLLCKFDKHNAVPLKPEPEPPPKSVYTHLRERKI